MDKEALIDLIVDSIQDIKGKNIVRLNLDALDERPTDCFIIAEGESNVQVKAIANNIYSRLKTEAKMLPSSFEGLKECQWVLLDYFTVVVHIFYPEARSFYELEALWSDAPKVTYEDV